jgi:Protein of unknown function (DUF3179)
MSQTLPSETTAPALAPAPEPTPEPPPAAAGSSSRPVLSRGLTLVAMVALLSFVGFEGATLLREFLILQSDLSRARAAAVVGYPGIHPEMSFAQRPRDWYHQEGNQLMLWGGWRRGVGHSWFKVGLGEIDRAHLSLPSGRDIQRPIDRPLVEVGGGNFWVRVPDEAVVAAGQVGGVETAYPIVILDKVAIVNDLIEDQPYLVTYNPTAGPAEQVGVYKSVVSGHRVTMGVSGLAQDGKPLLYDRGTESLWVLEPEAVRAVAGTHRGTVLKALSHPSTVSWSRWRSGHPQSRLVVGADRSAPRPEL